jgi:uncharacterized surface protein with fasciclin (FAS1) repeats
MKTVTRSLQSIILALAIVTAAPVVMAEGNSNKLATIVDVLSNTDGAQAVLAAVLVVDEAGALPFSLSELLGDRKSEVVLFAPSNAAFEKLLGIEQASLNGLTVDEIKGDLPGLLPAGVGVNEVAAVLLKHASLQQKANLKTASENALLTNGKITVADESELPVGVGASGVQVNYETTIIKADVLARNGVIHFVDTVIVDDSL